MNIFTQSDCSVYNLANLCTQYLFAKIIFEWCWTKRIGTEFNFRRVNPATGKMHFHGFAILAITWKSGFVGIEFQRRSCDTLRDCDTCEWLSDRAPNKFVTHWVIVTHVSDWVQMRSCDTIAFNLTALLSWGKGIHKILESLGCL